MPEVGVELFAALERIAAVAAAEMSKVGTATDDHGVQTDCLLVLDAIDRAAADAIRPHSDAIRARLAHLEAISVGPDSGQPVDSLPGLHRSVARRIGTQNGVPPSAIPPLTSEHRIVDPSKPPAPSPAPPPSLADLEPEVRR